MGFKVKNEIRYIGLFDVNIDILDRKSIFFYKLTPNTEGGKYEIIYYVPHTHKFDIQNIINIRFRSAVNLRNQYKNKQADYYCIF